LSQASSVSLGAAGLRATIRQRQLPGLPSFLHPPGSALCCSILALARADGFKTSLCHGQRTPWFLKMNESFLLMVAFYVHIVMLNHYRFDENLRRQRMRQRYFLKATNTRMMKPVKMMRDLYRRMLGHSLSILRIWMKGLHH